jgi:hypothetical protein
LPRACLRYVSRVQKRHFLTWPSNRRCRFLGAGQIHSRYRGNDANDTGLGQASRHRPPRGRFSRKALPCIPDRFRQQRVKLALGELLRLPRCRLAFRHNFVHRAGTGRQLCWLSLRHRDDLWLRRWRLVSALQAHPQQLRAHRIAAAIQPSCDLTCTVALGPEFGEQRDAGSIPHGILPYTQRVSADNTAIQNVQRGTRTKGQRCADRRQQGDLSVRSCTSSVSNGSLSCPSPMDLSPTIPACAFGVVIRDTPESSGCGTHCVCLQWEGSIRR